MPTDWLSKQRILGKQKTTDREKRVVKWLLPACKSNISLARATFLTFHQGGMDFSPTATKSHSRS